MHQNIMLMVNVTHIMSQRLLEHYACLNIRCAGRGWKYITPNPASTTGRGGNRVRSRYASRVSLRSFRCNRTLTGRTMAVKSAAPPTMNQKVNSTSWNSVTPQKNRNISVPQMTPPTREPRTG
jgi:hypothetical protein